MLTALIRSVAVYLCVILFMRLMGKRQLGQLQPGELVISVLISNVASLPIEDPDVSLVMGLLPAATLVGLELSFSRLSLRFRGVRTLLTGSPVVVIHEGKIDQNALRSLRFSLDDLMQALRAQGVFDLRQIDYALVETNGAVSVLLNAADAPATPKQLKLTLSPQPPPVVVVSDGDILPDGLRGARLSKKQLFRLLEKEGARLTDVFLLTVNSARQYTLVRKEARK